MRARGLLLNRYLSFTTPTTCHKYKKSMWFCTFFKAPEVKWHSAYMWVGLYLISRPQSFRHSISRFFNFAKNSKWLFQWLYLSLQLMVPDGKVNGALQHKKQKNAGSVVNNSCDNGVLLMDPKTHWIRQRYRANVKSFIFLNVALPFDLALHFDHCPDRKTSFKSWFDRYQHGIFLNYNSIVSLMIIYFKQFQIEQFLLKFLLKLTLLAILPIGKSTFFTWDLILML